MGNPRFRTLVAIGALSAAAWAQDPGWGIQASAVVDKAGDLKQTVGGGLGLAAGLHGDIALSSNLLLRSRAEAWFFPSGHEAQAGAPLSVDMSTTVKAQALGAEALVRVPATRLFVGGGLYAIHWSVATRETLAVPGGASAFQSGSTGWTREGLSALATYRLSRHLDLEARWVTSHYGVENLRTSVVLGGLAWCF